VKRKKKCKSMAYSCAPLADINEAKPRKGTTRLSGGIFAGKQANEWYVPLMICKVQVLAEDLAEQAGTTVK
jgi:hypothetical protein